MAAPLQRPPNSAGGAGHRVDHSHDVPREPLLDELWPNYLQGGYLDQSGNLKLEYVAREKVMSLIREMDRARPRLTMHQVRRFFQHCRAIEARLRARSSSWSAEESAFRKLDVAAADGFGKSNPKIPKLFHDFIQRNVAMVKTEQDFLKGFLPHFEALVGFGAQMLQPRERN
ncbi:MAG TPA: type III-A CRISPR-associated protein Csm2 [Verrucomicrobiae bacterium]|nr:type III-A CRISPR-associated protein Csm2 [Verrucomicrobiae bacterium]